MCRLALLSLPVIIGRRCWPCFPIICPRCSPFLPREQLLTVVGGRPRRLGLPGRRHVRASLSPSPPRPRPRPCPRPIPVPIASLSPLCPHCVPIASPSPSRPRPHRIPIPVLAPPNPPCEQLLAAEVGVLGRVRGSGRGLRASHPCRCSSGPVVPPPPSSLPLVPSCLVGSCVVGVGRARALAWAAFGLQGVRAVTWRVAEVWGA